MYKRIPKILLVVVMFANMLVPAVTSFAAETVSTEVISQPGSGNGTITDVTVSTDSITVSGWVCSSTNQQLQVFELKPYEDATSGLLSGKAAIVSTSITPEGTQTWYSFTATLNRTDSAGADRIYSKFTVALNASGTYTIINSKHVTTISDIALNNYVFPASATKKGLQVQTIDDAQDLGIGHAALNVTYQSILQASGGISYVMDGQTYCMNSSAVGSLDKQVKELSDKGIVVTLILLMQNTSTAPASYMEHPNYNGTAAIAAFNTTNDNLKYFKAVTEFLVERYTRSDQAYGRAVNYIVGNEVNSNYAWYNEGTTTLQNFVKDYERTVRIAYYAAKKKYSNARVYISLDNCWTISSDPSNSMSFHGKDVIDQFNTLAVNQGNFGWNVAFHPYPADIANPRTWNDAGCTDSFSTQRITFKNIAQLPNYLGQSAFLYQGEQRRVILSEEGFNTPAPDNYSDQLAQAAGYAYGYYKTLFNSGIDSFILHRHVDHGGEGGLNLGLWQHTPSSTNDPSQKKYIWDVFRDIDTSQSQVITEFALPIIGITDWSTVIPGYNSAALGVRTPPAIGNLGRLSSVSGATAIAGFDTNTESWEVSDYSQSIARVTTCANAPTTPYNGSGMLEVSLNNPTNKNGAAAWASASKKFATPLDLSSIPLVYFAINAYGGCPGATKYYANIRLYSGNSIMEGKMQIAGDKWSFIGMDISGWSGKASIDRIKIWFNTDSQVSWNGRYQIDYVGAAASGVFYDIPANLALNKPATANNYITGGMTASGVTDGSYSSIFSTQAFGSSNVSSNPVWVDIDLGSNQTINQVKLIPRTDVSAAGGGSPNFPVNFTIQTAADGSSTYTTRATVTNQANPGGAGKVYSFTAVSARHVRIRATTLGAPASGDSSNYRLQLSEVEVYNSPAANLASGKTVTASENISGWVPGNLSDGNYANCYSSNERASSNISGSPIWVEVDLGANQNISSIKLFPRTDTAAVGGGSPNFPANFTIQTKPNGGSSYTTALTVSNQKNPYGMAQCYKFTSVSARYVRINVTALGTPANGESTIYRLQLNEMEVR